MLKYDGHEFEPMHIFLSRSGEIGKSHLGKVTYKAISKILLYHYKVPEKERVFLLAPIGISEVNTGETTICYGCEIKPRTKLLGSNGKSKAALTNWLSAVKPLITDKLSMIFNDLRTDID